MTEPSLYSAAGCGCASIDRLSSRVELLVGVIFLRFFFFFFLTSAYKSWSGCADENVFEVVLRVMMGDVDVELAPHARSPEIS